MISRRVDELPELEDLVLTALARGGRVRGRLSAGVLLSDEPDALDGVALALAGVVALEVRAQSLEDNYLAARDDRLASGYQHAHRREKSLRESHAFALHVLEIRERVYATAFERHLSEIAKGATVWVGPT